MSRYLAFFFITIFSLLLAGSTQAAVVRVDDLVILNGTSLQLYPIGGFNDTTRNRTWQINYFDTLDLLRINEIYQQANQNGSISQRHIEKRSGAACV